MCPRAALRSFALIPATLLLILIAGPTNRAEPAGNSAGGRLETMSGHFTGTAVTFFVDREVVESWLPGGLQLSEECPFEKHPVIFLFGTQRDIAHEGVVTFKPRYARNGRFFHEAFVAIPYLELTGSSYGGPVFHFVRVYLDHPKPASQGARRAGWPKILTAIDAGGQSYEICRGPWGTIFRAETDRDDARPVDPENASLEQVKAMLSQPLVLKHEGCFELHHFNFHFDCAGIRAVSSHVEIAEGFMPGLEPIERDFGGIDEAEFGAFTFNCRYTNTSRN